ncbi:MAG TPA: 16S rRNA (adenine(1518)-N(6)/adenine(1519)-N(6))-dimethyltransferase RsmA [Acidimicrobiales bacterium]|nr:16S rRNA (adenine(1518)-N(6)/adenine(1519)-N(6))-dimethyltransferase RsmA [Acidimicrobiales bacterium]
MTLTRQEVRNLVARHGLRPSRALGQHFVADPNTVRRIARLAGVGAGDHVVEIGAGLGSLTLALAESGADVTAVETDRYLLPVLREVVASTSVRVIEADARSLDWEALLGPEPGRWVLVANLPYNMAASLVVDVLEKVPAVGRMLVMVQREVGERLAAGPGSAAYGAVSVRVAYWAMARVVGRVPATVFVPEPKVSSVLVALERLEEPAIDPLVASYGDVFELVRAGFAQRRKMLRGALAGLATPEDLRAAGVRPEARAEELDVHAWGTLAACLSEGRNAGGSSPPPS